MGKFNEMNAVWDGWVSPGNTPARATVQAKLAAAGYKVEIMVVAALTPGIRHGGAPAAFQRAGGATPGPPQQDACGRPIYRRDQRKCYSLRREIRRIAVEYIF